MQAGCTQIPLCLLVPPVTAAQGHYRQPLVAIHLLRPRPPFKTTTEHGPPTHPPVHVSRGTTRTPH